MHAKQESYDAVVQEANTVQSESYGSAVMNRHEDPLAATLRQAVVEKVKEWADSIPEPDNPIITSATEGGDAELVSPRQLVSHIENRTELGEHVVQNWVGLLVRNIKDIPL